MTIVNYPTLHHLGFKILCGWYVFNSIQYMNTSIEQKHNIQREQKKIIKLLEGIKDK
jgi:hypothetical protein